MKRFVGSGWEHKFGVSIAIKVEDIKDLPLDKFGCVRLDVCKHKNEREKGESTHWVAVDDYTYERLEKKNAEVKAAVKEVISEMKNELPF